MNNAIHWIRVYPEDSSIVFPNTYPISFPGFFRWERTLGTRLILIHSIVIYSVDSAIHVSTTGARTISLLTYTYIKFRSLYSNFCFANLFVCKSKSLQVRGKKETESGISENQIRGARSETHRLYHFTMEYSTANNPFDLHIHIVTKLKRN